MTSTSVFQGSFGDKPSSRVIRPPGGGSSNIFGVPEPQQPVATEGATQGSGSNVNEQLNETPSNNSTASEVSNEVPSDQSKPEAVTAKPRKNAGYNPITGEPYGDAEATQAKQGIAVRQPPGGHSSKLW